MRRISTLLVPACLAALVLASAGTAATPVQGKVIFDQKCAGCHSLGQGVKVGPDLAGVTRRRTPAWLRKFIESPSAMFAAKDTTALALLARFKVQMPTLGLSGADIDALVAYLGSKSGTGGKPSQPGQGKTPAAGDATNGKNLFTGAAQFAHGGPPCLSCHSIASIGSLGGGALGPDLTGAYAKYGGDKGMASILAALPFPTMIPVFRGHSLTAPEQADLLAFLRGASHAQRPADAVWKLVLLGLAAAIFGIAIALVVWPRRRLVVRRRIAPTYTPTRRG